MRSPSLSTQLLVWRRTNYYIGKTMLGTNIFRNISPNIVKEDEKAYVNRMKIYHKDNLKSNDYISDNNEYWGNSFPVSLQFWYSEAQNA